MGSIAAAQQLTSVGRFRAALEALPPQEARRDSPSVQLLRAELLALVGQCTSAQEIVERLRNQRILADRDKSHFEFVSWIVAMECGDIEEELQHLQKCIFYAERAGDLERTCWAQFELASRLADRSGPDAVETLVTSLRTNATKLGEPKITAALHVLVAVIDGKRGLLDPARQHTRLALRLLASSSHLAIQVACQTNLAAISIVRCDFDDALTQGQLALETSVECGALKCIRTSLSNLGHIHMTQGRFEVALEHFQKVLGLCEYQNENVFVARESIAQLHLAQGKTSESLPFVDFPDEPARGIGGHTHRHAQLTKAKILARLNRRDESVHLIERTISLARQAGDTPLVAIATMFQAEAFLHCGRTSESWNLITTVLPMLVGRPPDAAAKYERALACVLAAEGDISAGQVHRNRSARILESLQSKPELAELDHSWQQAEKLGASMNYAARASRDSGSSLQNIAMLMMHAGRPNLLASGLVAILEGADCATGAVATARDENGNCEELGSFGTIAPGAQTRTLTLGTARNRTVE